MSKGTPKQYLQMWLSEQISPLDWLMILEERKDVRELYHKYLKQKDGGSDE